MTYENPAIPHTDIPRYAEVPLHPVEPAYKKVLHIGWALFFGLILAAVVTLYLLIEALQTSWYLAAVMGIWIASVALTSVVIEIGFRHRAWALRERDVVFRKGWLFQSTHIVPFVKIQHCVVRSGPIERRFGLASIQLMTAAGMDLDIVIRGLKQETAERLKEWVVERTAAYARTGV